jgi:hypothetical protein
MQVSASLSIGSENRSIAGYAVLWYTPPIFVTVHSPLLVTTPERGNALSASLVQADAERRTRRSNAEHWNEEVNLRLEKIAKENYVQEVGSDTRVMFRVQNV